ncbi:MAG: cobalamin-binding protein [Thalassotalea sp.]
MKYCLVLCWFALVITHVSAQEKSPEVKIAKQRIVALAPHIVEMLFDIGAGQQIVGTVEYADHPEAAKAIPRIGGYYGLQIEKVLTLQPDIVFAWKNGNKKVNLEQLARLGIKIIYSDPKDIGDVATELRYFGQLLGKSAQAEIAADLFEKKLANIRQQYLNQPSVKVFYQLWPQPMMTINKNTWIHQLLSVCQADNVFADNSTDYPQISIENVMVAQPEIIIIPEEKSKKVQPKIEWHKWPEIPAVKANAFIHANADLLHRFSTRMLTGLEILCSDIENTRSALSDQSSTR